MRSHFRMEIITYFISHFTMPTECIGNSIPLKRVGPGAFVALNEDITPIVVSTVSEDEKGSYAGVYLPQVVGKTIENGGIVIYFRSVVNSTEVFSAVFKFFEKNAVSTKSIGFWGNKSQLTNVFAEHGYELKNLTNVSLSNATTGILALNSFCLNQTSDIPVLINYIKRGGFVFLELDPDMLKSLEMHPSYDLLKRLQLHVINVKTNGPLNDRMTSMDLSWTTNTANAAKFVLHLMTTSSHNISTGGIFPSLLHQLIGILKLSFHYTEAGFYKDLPWVNNLKRSVLANVRVVPTEDNPTAPTPWNLFQVNLELIVYTYLLQAHEVLPNPAHVHFPGKVTQSIVTSHNRIIRLSGSSNSNDQEDQRVSCSSWCSTGLYAPAGNKIHLTLQSQYVVAFTVLIGCHRDDLLQRQNVEWVRYPKIIWSKEVKGNVTLVASPFGGLIYLKKVSLSQSLQALPLEVTGAVDTNSFTFQETSVIDWRKKIGNITSPWTELVSDKIVFSIPTTAAVTIERPDEVMAFWIKVVDTMADMAGYPSFHRIAFDIDLIGGVMHSGNPIMGYVSHTMDALDLNLAKGYNGWVFLHELGHNLIKQTLKMEGMAEVTCNIFASFVGQTLLNHTPMVAHHENDLGGMVNKLQQYTNISESLRFSHFQKQSKRGGVASIFVYHLESVLGWNAFKRMFRQYNNQSPQYEASLTDQEKWDLLFIRLSQSSDYNLLPLFTSWSIPISVSAQAQVLKLPKTNHSFKTFYENLELELVAEQAECERKQIRNVSEHPNKGNLTQLIHSACGTERKTGIFNSKGELFGD